MPIRRCKTRDLINGISSDLIRTASELKIRPAHVIPKVDNYRPWACNPREQQPKDSTNSNNLRQSK